MTTKKRWGARLRGALLAGAAGAALGAGAGPAAAIGFTPATHQTNLSCSIPTGADEAPAYSLRATTGRISTPDGGSVYMWGYAEQGGVYRNPGPTLCVDAGDTVTVTLTNELPEDTSMVFPGQSDVVAAGGAPGLLAQQAPAAGGTVSYTFTATNPGTYVYQSGTDAQKQTGMGLYGALIVRPAGNPNQVYDDPATAFDPAREYLFLFHEIDPALHSAVEHGNPYASTKFHPKYWTISGRMFPDTLSDNGAPWLPAQPQGAMVWTQPGQEALIRYANAGIASHPFHPHGNHVRMVGRDGRLMAGAGGEGSLELFTKTLAPGETAEAFLRFDDVDTNDPDTTDPSTGKPPVVFPVLQNLAFKGGVTFYSGSPLLGQKGEFPAKTTVLNQCGEFYFPMHSHALFEFQNFNEGFGGMATLFRVDPAGGCTP
jgi:FtsP/CotA-like multicopper oxidase with cupredoxin domain